MRLRACAIGVCLLALGGAGPAQALRLPDHCPAGGVPPHATVSFVARGRAWALDPRKGAFGCLFTVRDSGPFAWGPRGDRVLLAHLEVRSLGRGPHRPPSRVSTRSASWGRPIGKSIVFVGRGGHALLKTHPAGGRFHDVTPVRGATYKRVVYHPSGLAFGFVLKRKGRESLWISSNTGKNPHRLVHGRFHTGFEALAFAPTGDVVYFAGRHADKRVHLHYLELVGATSAPVMWKSEPGEHVYSLLPGDLWVAFTVGHSCASRRTELTALDDHFRPILPRPNRAVGWLDTNHLLVAVGGCGKPLDLYSLNSSTQQSRLLVRGVESAATRRPEDLPPPPLPRAERGARSSFA